MTTTISRPAPALDSAATAVLRARLAESAQTAHERGRASADPAESDFHLRCGMALGAGGAMGDVGRFDPMSGAGDAERLTSRWEQLAGHSGTHSGAAAGYRAAVELLASFLEETR